MATHRKNHEKNKGTNELVFKGENQQYADVIEPRGDARFFCQPLQGSPVLAKLVGSLIKGPKKKYVAKGDFVLLQKDTNTTEKEAYYIVHKYSEEERKNLKKQGELKIINIVKKEDKEKNTTIIIGDDDGVKEEEGEVDEVFLNDL